MDVPTLTLNNGIMMPQFGLGVWQARDGQEVEDAVSAALAAGYRLIDTAAIYGNEAGVGRAIKASGIPRDQLFITTKLWNSDQGYESALKAFDTSLSKLGLDYLDLYLIHWPVPARDRIADTWKAFEKLYADKRVRAIGVSNFKPNHLEKLLSTAAVVPAVNQIELHPRMQQLETRDFCDKHTIKIESWSPLMQGGDVLSDPVITKLATTYNKTAAQIVLRWHIDSGLIVIPKSVHANRIQENIDIFDFKLSAENLAAIKALNEDRRTGPDPDHTNFT